jgi:DNA-binding response OmpR family regulator
VAQLLLVEDDVAIRTSLIRALTERGHAVTSAPTAMAGLQAAVEPGVELVLLDLGLPDLDGLTLLTMLRAVTRVPVIITTARDDEQEIVKLLEAGADDYVIKPVEPAVLDARIRAVLRRADNGQASRSVHGDLVIDRGSLRVTRAGAEVHLTPTELRLLLELTRHSGQVLSRNHLLRAVWDHGYAGDSRLVDASVQRLRAKVEPDAAAPTLIQTVRGFGYRFAAP